MSAGEHPASKRTSFSRAAFPKHALTAVGRTGKEHQRTKESTTAKWDQDSAGNWAGTHLSWSPLSPLPLTYRCSFSCLNWQVSVMHWVGQVPATLPAALPLRLSTLPVECLFFFFAVTVFPFCHTFLASLHCTSPHSHSDFLHFCCWLFLLQHILLLDFFICFC